MDLFQNKPTLRFEKLAAVQLDEDPETWARAILTELFRVVPETSDYTPRVSMMKIDEEQGFGIGVVVVENSTDSALSAVRENPSTTKALIPVVIKAHELMPLDLLMTKTGKMMPLTGRTLREALFRPETFEMTTDDWGDTGLYNQFYPPGRSDNTFGAGIAQGIGGGTQGAVTFIQGPGMKFSMLEAISGTLLGSDIDELRDSAEAVLPAVSTKSAFLRGLQVLAEEEASAIRDTSGILKQAAAGVPDVFQFSYYDDSYYMKTAASRSYAGVSTKAMTRGEMLKLSQDLTKRVDTDGAVTISKAAAAASPTKEAWAVVEKPGIYKVKSVSGKELTGWVLPNLIDTDGTIVPMTVFTNGSGAMVQDQVMGVRSSTYLDLPSSAPTAGSTGCFYVAAKAGGAVQATVPLVVLGEDTNSGWVVRTLTGEESKVRVAPGLASLTAAGGEFHMPEGTKFLPLTDEKLEPLASTPEEQKTSSGASMRLIGDSHTIQISFSDMPKLASVVGREVSFDNAVFALCLGGLDAKTAFNKVAEAATGRAVTVQGSDITLAKDLIAETSKQAAKTSADVRSLRTSLVKEAAVLPDTMTVDAVLSLGFVNSENIDTFIKMVPHLERCLHKVCETVLGARLGLTEVPEAAAVRAAKALDQVIQGLKALGLKTVED